MKKYVISLQNGDEFVLNADDDEDAAWQAENTATEYKTFVVDVVPLTDLHYG